MIEKGRANGVSGSSRDELDQLIDDAFGLMRQEQGVDLRRQVLSSLEEPAAESSLFAGARAKRVLVLTAAGLMAAVALKVYWYPTDRQTAGTALPQSAESAAHRSGPSRVSPTGTLTSDSAPSNAAGLSADASDHRALPRVPGPRRQSNALVSPIERASEGTPEFDNSVAPIPDPAPITASAIVSVPIIPVGIVAAPGVSDLGSPVAAFPLTDPPRNIVAPGKPEGVRR